MSRMMVVHYGGAPMWPDSDVERPAWPIPAGIQPVDTFTISPRLSDVVEQRLNEARIGVIETIDWILRGHRMGEFDAAEAMKRIERAMGAVK